MNDNKDEARNYPYIFAKDILEYNQRKGKMEYFDPNLCIIQFMINIYY